MCSLERENNMNKLFAKISALVLGLTMSIGVGVAVSSSKNLETRADTASFTPTDFSGQGTSDTGSAISATKNTVTFSCDKGYGYSTGQVRCYSGGKITISSSNTITAISFSFTSSSYKGGLNTSYTSLSTNSWQGTLTGTARISGCTVTYSTGGGDTPEEDLFDGKAFVFSSNVGAYIISSIGTSAAKPSATTTKASAAIFLFTSVGTNQYTLKLQNGTNAGKYLYASSKTASNSEIYVRNNAYTWTLEKSSDKYYLKNTDNNYLASNSTTDWRMYGNKTTGSQQFTFEEITLSIGVEIKKQTGHTDPAISNKTITVNRNAAPNSSFTDYLTATVTNSSSDSTVTWTVGGTNASFVTSRTPSDVGNTLTLVFSITTAGSFTVTATSDEDNTKSDTITYIVQNIPVTGISVESYSYEDNRSGNTITLPRLSSGNYEDMLTATLTPADPSDTTINWDETDTDNLVTIDPDGDVCGITFVSDEAGTFTITATATGGTNVSISITYVIEDVPVTGLTLVSENFETNRSENTITITKVDNSSAIEDSLSVTLTPSLPSDSSITWSLSDEDDIVDETSIVYDNTSYAFEFSKAEVGTFSITATANGGNNVTLTITYVIQETAVSSIALESELSPTSNFVMIELNSNDGAVTEELTVLLSGVSGLEPYDKSITWSISGKTALIDDDIENAEDDGWIFDIITTVVGTVTITATANGGENKTASITYQVAKTVTDVITKSTTGVTGTGYSDWSDKTVTSDAVYAGNSAGNNDSVQLRTDNSNSGVVTTASGGKVAKITVTWNSATSNGRSIDIYGKNTAYSSSSDLYGDNQGDKLGSIAYGTSTELIVSGDYAYVGIRSNNGALYLTNISIVWIEETIPTISLDKSSISAYSDDEDTYTLTASVKNITPTSYSWSLSGDDTDAIDIDLTDDDNSIDFTIVKEGTLTISVSATDGNATTNTASCEVTINAVGEPTLVISSGTGNTSYKFGEELDTTDWTATYTDKYGTEHSDVLDSLEFDSIEFIGTKPIKATYLGTESNTVEITVTNNGATCTDTEALLEATKFSKGSMPDGWSQTGAGSNYADSHDPYLLKMDDDGDTITATVNTSASTVYASLGVKKIGGSTNSSFDVTAKDLDGKTVATGTLTISGAQNSIVTPVATLSNPNGKTITSIEFVFVKGSNVGVGTGRISILDTSTFAPKQALAFARYFLEKTNGYCEGTISSSDKTSLINEFNWMLPESIAAFKAATIVRGKGASYENDLSEAISRYVNMIEDKGYSDADFLNLGNDVINKSNAIYNGLQIVVNNQNSTLLIIISVVSLTSIGGYFFIRRRREH